MKTTDTKRDKMKKMIESKDYEKLKFNELMNMAELCASSAVQEGVPFEAIELHEETKRVYEFYMNNGNTVARKSDTQEENDSDGEKMMTTLVGILAKDLFASFYAIRKFENEAASNRAEWLMWTEMLLNRAVVVSKDRQELLLCAGSFQMLLNSAEDANRILKSIFEDKLPPEMLMQADEDPVKAHEECVTFFKDNETEIIKYFGKRVPRKYIDFQNKHQEKYNKDS